MPDIERIIYLPTLLCNCKCEHCGEEQRLQEAECSCELIERRILESEHFKGGRLSISGSEPFLKDGFSPMLARLCNLQEWQIDITTNGICTERIKKFCDLAEEETRQKVIFAVSIDGMPDVHNHIRRNPVAFEKAIETVRFLKSKGVAVQINTVIQRENYNTLDEFSSYIENLCEGVRMVWIPEIAALAGRQDFPYTQEELGSVLQRTEEQGDLIGKVYLEKHGNVRLKGCHAGRRTFAISPAGKLYACTIGLCYMGLENREKYYIGDLKEHSLDELYEICQDEKAPFRMTVANCAGCWGNCEVENELIYWNQRLDDYLPHVIEGKSQLRK